MKRLLPCFALLLAAGCTLDPEPSAERVAECDLAADTIRVSADLRGMGVSSSGAQTLVSLASAERSSQLMAIARFTYANPDRSASQLSSATRKLCLREGIDSYARLL